jgi:hypothetical protein
MDVKSSIILGFSIIFVGKTRGLLYGGHLKGAPLGHVLALLKNIRLGWRGLPGTNTVAFWSLRGHNDNTYKDFTYNDNPYSGITCNKF